jgi:Uma2 family endonuclease
MAIAPLRKEIEYPESDGQPMGETTLHRKVMMDLIAALERRFREMADVWVGGNLFLYFEEGNPKAAVAPDVLVVRGVAKWDRPIYKLWEEGRPPSLVIEVTSNKTRREDMLDKKARYERLGVEEYVLFDPEGDYLAPRLQGHRLDEGRYRSIEPGEDGSLESRTTGLTFRPEGLNLRLSDTATGQSLPWLEEMDTALLAAEDKVRSLEEELARLRRERG